MVKHFTIKICDKIFGKNIINSVYKIRESDDVSTLAERHYQVKKEKYSMFKMPTWGKLTTWLLIERGEIEFGITEHKSMK